jgi:glycosyltransferase involved in cell wall biosynthesis
MCYDVSVVIPFYNGNAFLADNLTSLNNQNLFFEVLIIVDNGSEMPSVNEENYTNLDICILHTSSSKNGAGLIRAQGFARAKARYVMFLDPDDFIVKNALTEYIQHFRRSNFAFGFAKFFITDPDGKITGLYHFSDQSFTLDGFYKKTFTIGCLTVLIDKHKIHTFASNDLNKRNDYKAWSHLIRECDNNSLKWGGLDYIPSCHRLHAKSLTNNKLKSVVSQFMFYKSEGFSFGKCLYFLAFYVFNTLRSRYAYNGNLRSPRP